MKIIKLAVFTLCILGCSLPVSAQKNKRPHVIFIVADDLGYEDIFHKDRADRTPHIDQLIREGLYFTNAHAVASSCAPSHYSLHTGEYCWKKFNITDLINQTELDVQAEQLTTGRLFREAGYHTATFGRWFFDHGLGSRDETGKLQAGPLAMGFDEAWLLSPGDSTCLVIAQSPLLQDQADILQLEFPAIMDSLTQHTTRFLQEKREKPLFLYLSTYNLSEITGADISLFQLDQCIGMIEETLEKMGEKENTLLIFTSDNGPVKANRRNDKNTSLRGGKYSNFEGGTRIPLIVSWPKTVNRGYSDALFSHIDIPASFAGLLGSELPEGAFRDGENKIRTLLGKERKNRPFVIKFGGTFSVYDGTWKFIAPVKGKADDHRTPGPDLGNSTKTQMYNLLKDPSEQENVADQQIKRVEELRHILEKELSIF